MKTAMQEVILKMQEAKDNFPNIGFDDEFIRGFNKAFQMAIFITEKVGIDKEKQQIIESGNTCALRMRILHDKIQGMTTDELLAEADKKTMTLGEEYYNEISEPKQTPQ